MATVPRTHHPEERASLPVKSQLKAEKFISKKTGTIFSSYDSNWIPYPFLKHSLWLGDFHVPVGLDLGSCSNYSGRLDGTMFGQSEREEGEHPLEHLGCMGEEWEDRQTKILLGKRKRGMDSG